MRVYKSAPAPINIPVFPRNKSGSSVVALRSLLAVVPLCDGLTVSQFLDLAAIAQAFISLHARSALDRARHFIPLLKGSFQMLNGDIRVINNSRPSPAAAQIKCTQKDGCPGTAVAEVPMPETELRHSGNKLESKKLCRTHALEAQTRCYYVRFFGQTDAQALFIFNELVDEKHRRLRMVN